MAVIPYTWGADEQRDVIGLACAQPRFFQRIGRHIDPESLTDEIAREGCKLIQFVAKTAGHPNSPSALRLHAKNLVADGKMKLDTSIAIAEMVDLAVDRTDGDAVADAVADELRRRAEREATAGVISAITSRGDRRRAAEVLLAATEIGAAPAGDLEPTTSLTQGLEQGPRGSCLGTGVRPLDDALRGGLRRGTMGFYLGHLNEGKSMQLTMQAAHAIRIGCFVALATNENSVFKQKARIFSCLTRVPLTDLEDGSKIAWTEALQRFKELNILGGVWFKCFTASVARPADIFEWIADVEAHEVRGKIDLVIIDHADNLTEDVGAGDKQRGAVPKRVYENCRSYAVSENKYLWTASHAVRKRSEGKKTVEILKPEHTANCIDKARIADLAVSINICDEEGKTTTYHVARNRDGDAGGIIGPLERLTQFGMIAPMGDLDSEAADPFDLVLALPGHPPRNMFDP